MGHSRGKRIITRPRSTRTSKAHWSSHSRGMVRLRPLPSSKAYSWQGHTTAPFLGCSHPPESRQPAWLQESSMAVMRPWCRTTSTSRSPTSSPRSSPSVRSAGPTSMNPSSIAFSLPPIRILCLHPRAMRLALLACLAAVACSHATLPGTNIRDTPENRDVLNLFGRYKQALEARDATAILAMAAPSYTDTGDPARGVSPMDYGTLQQKLKTDFAKVTGVRLEATIKGLDVRGEKWKSESDDARMQFVRVNGEWRIASGL